MFEIIANYIYVTDSLMGRERDSSGRFTKESSPKYISSRTSPSRENESSPTSLSSVNREIMSYDWVKINESMQRNIPLQIWDSKDNDFVFTNKTMIYWKQSFNHNIVSGRHTDSWSHMIWNREIKNYLRSLGIFVLF